MSNILTGVTKEGYYHLQGAPSPKYRDPEEITPPPSTIICSKVRVHNGSHKWDLIGSKVFKNVLLWDLDDALRIDADIRINLIVDHFEHFKTNVMPQFGRFEKSFFANQINTGVPNSSTQFVNAEALLNVICEVEGLEPNTLKFMMDEYIAKNNDRSDKIVHFKGLQ